ncbi:MAG: hypothetical protein QOG66_1312, partial [Methylobacteriaceae bacterium]|nr:hypothetical protein [Methylobacteriaceae bacterium]
MPALAKAAPEIRHRADNPVA